MIRTIIGIDPDIDKSGIAVYMNGKYTKITTMWLWDLFELLYSCNSINDYIIIIEDSNLKTNTWHKGGRGAASNVGKNKAISKQIVMFCKHHNLLHKAVEPSGYSTYFDKIGKQQYGIITGGGFNNNAETRSAVAIVECNKDYYYDKN